VFLIIILWKHFVLFFYFWRVFLLESFAASFKIFHEICNDFVADFRIWKPCACVFFSFLRFLRILLVLFFLFLNVLIYQCHTFIWLLLNSEFLFFFYFLFYLGAVLEISLRNLRIKVSIRSLCSFKRLFSKPFFKVRVSECEVTFRLFHNY